LTQLADTLATIAAVEEGKSNSDATVKIPPDNTIVTEPSFPQAGTR
jgi:hypothetical protein